MTHIYDEEPLEPKYHYCLVVCADICCVSSVVECGLFLESRSGFAVCVVYAMDVVLFVRSSLFR